MPLTQPPHYSSFGSSLPNRAWSDVSRGYRLGFNGMEKDSKTANDAFPITIGIRARVYDGRFGRWLSLDPLSVLYQELSNFSSFANNPILYIDNQGETLVIKNGGVSAMYFEGKLYTQGADGNYTIPYIAGTNTFVDETFSNIELLNATSTGKSTLLRLSDKTAEEYTILDGNTEVHRNVYGVEVARGDSYTNSTNTIYFTNKDDNEIPVSYFLPGQTRSPAFIILGHEMGHALGELDYIYNSDIWFYQTTEFIKGYSKSEIYASHIENMLRSENNLPLRTYYSSYEVYYSDFSTVSTDLLTNNNESIFFKCKKEIQLQKYEIEGEVYNPNFELTSVTSVIEVNYNYSENNNCEKNCD